MIGADASSMPQLIVPDDLSERDQWVLWRYEARQGKQTKVPYQTNGSRASSTDPVTWATLAEARETWSRFPRRYNGLGFVFTKEDDLVGIDLDDCLDSRGATKEWARGIVERFADTYMEVSPSGNGVKIWARGSLPSNLSGVAVGDGMVEMYDHARYFAVTGRVFRDAPVQVEDHTEDLLALHGRLAPTGKAWPVQPKPNGGIPKGRQHNTLVSICGTLRVRNVCDEAIEACLQIVNRNQCEEPGPPEHISRIVRSSRKWGTR